MKTKFLFILIGIIIVLFLTGCSTSESEMNDDIFNQTTEATTMAPAQNQDGDPVENQEIQQVESIDDSIKISILEKEILTNKLFEGKKYTPFTSEQKLPDGISPIGFPRDILSSNLSYTKTDNEHYLYNFKYANPDEKRYVFFQTTSAEDFKDVDDEFIMSLEQSTINGTTVYIFSYPSSNFDADCFCAYYGKLGYRCILESVNLTQEEFLEILSSSV